MKDYVIIEDYHKRPFEESVQQMIDKGYVCISGVSMTWDGSDYGYHQAMALPGVPA